MTLNDPGWFLKCPKMTLSDFHLLSRAVRDQWRRLIAAQIEVEPGQNAKTRLYFWRKPKIKFQTM